MIFRFILLTTFIGLISHVSFAQMLTPVREEWRSIQPSNEEFAIDAPLELKVDGEIDAKSSRKYYVSFNGTYLYVFSDPAKSPNNLKTVKRFVELMGRALDEGKVSGPPARISFADSYGYWQNISVIRTESRIYVAQTVSKNEIDPMVNRFINSFGLGPTHFVEPEKSEIKTVETAPTPEIKPLVPATPSSGNGKGSGSGNGTGYGQGSGSGSGSGIGTSQTNTVPRQTSTIKILSKAKPSYTDFARFYVITGTVITRVIFLASGEVGMVRPMTSLPFGLTEQAVAAAKRIGFQPAYLDGKPVNIVKQVEYSFSLY
ncbi:MAG: energy transducer TonB [Pyrinomonadaceae bacterium]